MFNFSKKYRIKNYRDLGYKVQERFWLFFWHTFAEGRRTIPKRFATVQDAKEFIQRQRQERNAVKRAKYVEYV